MLAEGLSYNRTLQTLDLSSNNISRDGILAISKLLLDNDSLSYLILTSNRIESDGAIYLSKALLASSSLVG